MWLLNSFIPVGYVLVVSTRISRDSPRNGLFFNLSGRIYNHSDTVYIEDIGHLVIRRQNPGAALVCNTTYVNTNCCRNSDNNGNGSIGNWFYPDNSPVIQNRETEVNSTHNIFVRVGYDREIRLVKSGIVTGPLGIYTCQVPNENGAMVSACIYIISIHSKTTSSSPQRHGITEEPISNMMFCTSSNCSVPNENNGISSISANIISSTYISVYFTTMEESAISGTSSMIRVAAAVISVAVIFILVLVLSILIIVLYIKKKTTVNASKNTKEGMSDKANYTEIQLYESGHSKPEEILTVSCAAYGNISGKKETGEESDAVYETV